MSKQTAVEWLIEQLNNVRPTQICSIETIKEWCQQAKAIEKEQIIDARENGLNEGVEIANNPYYTKWLLSEQYYNETYKGGQDV